MGPNLRALRIIFLNQLMASPGFLLSARVGTLSDSHGRAPSCCSENQHSCDALVRNDLSSNHDDTTSLYLPLQQLPRSGVLPVYYLLSFLFISI